MASPPKSTTEKDRIQTPSRKLVPQSAPVFANLATIKSFLGGGLGHDSFMCPHGGGRCVEDFMGHTLYIAGKCVMRFESADLTKRLLSL